MNTKLIFLILIILTTIPLIIAEDDIIEQEKEARDKDKPKDEMHTRPPIPNNKHPTAPLRGLKAFAQTVSPAQTQPPTMTEKAIELINDTSQKSVPLILGTAFGVAICFTVVLIWICPMFR